MAFVTSGEIVSSPLDRLTDEQKPPASAKSSDVRAWSADEADRFASAAFADDDPVALALVFAMRTGLRRGELVGLRWGDVAEVERADGRRAGEVTIRRAVVMVEGQRVETTPKTDGALRTIPVPASVMEVLDRVRRRQASDRLAAGEGWEGAQAGADDAPVFRNTDGTPVHPQQCRHPLDRIAKSVELPRRTVHELRHTFATIALVVHRIPVPVVSAWLGHASPSITLDVYSHVLRDVAEDYADRLGETYGSG